jgi:hypothetical protein
MPKVLVDILITAATTAACAIATKIIDMAFE